MITNAELAALINAPVGFMLPIEIAVVILIGAAAFYLFWASKIDQTRRIILKLSNLLELSKFTGSEALSLLTQAIKDKQIKSLLLETKDNLVEVDGDLGPEYYSLRNYSEIWTARGVLTGRMNLSLFETMPNILIGIGLMFTFGFLAFALSDAGRAMDIGADRDGAMKDLISNAGGKFITSIIGLFCSLFWNWRAKIKIDQLQTAMFNFHAVLRKNAPDTAAQAIVKQQHFVLREILAESRAQVGQLKRFETDIAVAIAKAIGQELNPAFKNLGKELVDSLRALTDRIGNMNQDALEKMIKQFLESFTATSSKEMNAFKDVLDQLAKNLESAGANFGTAMGGVGETFGSAAGMLESAISKTQQTVQILDASLDKAGEVIDSGSERFELVSDKLLINMREVSGVLVGVDEFIEKIQTNIGMLNNIADTLDDTVSAQKEVSTQFKDAVPKMANALETAVQEITLSSQAAAKSLEMVREALDNTKESLKETVTSISTGVDQYTEKVRVLHMTLDTQIGQAISKIGGAMQDIGETFDELVESLPKT
jgi:ABC-type transporter Mla subunit MlaD